MHFLTASILPLAYDETVTRQFVPPPPGHQEARVRLLMTAASCKYLLNIERLEWLLVHLFWPPLQPLSQDIHEPTSVSTLPTAVMRA